MNNFVALSCENRWIEEIDVDGECGGGNAWSGSGLG